jgi:hypothetical protein
MGMKATMIRRLPDGREWHVIWEMIMPLTLHLVYTAIPRTDEAADTYERVRAASFCIPVDDTHQLGARIEWVPAGDDRPDGPRRETMGPTSRRDQSYEYTQRYPDDKEAMEGQGPIALHGLEHLASSDRGVIMFRQILRREIAAVRAGRDPKGVLRDPEQAESVPTTGGSKVQQPVEHGL